MTPLERIRGLVHELLARRGVRETVANDAPLLTSGLLDSVDVLEVVALLEAEFGVDFSIRPFVPEEFDTITGIVAHCAQ